MRWVAYNDGKEIPFWLGILIGLDQFLGSCWPGANVDETISSRLGRLEESCRLTWHRHPVARLVYLCLDRIQKNHCEDSIGS